MRWANFNHFQRQDFFGPHLIFSARVTVRFKTLFITQAWQFMNFYPCMSLTLTSSPTYHLHHQQPRVPCLPSSLPSPSSLAHHASLAYYRRHHQPSIPCPTTITPIRTQQLLLRMHAIRHCQQHSLCLLRPPCPHPQHIEHLLPLSLPSFAQHPLCSIGKHKGTRGVPPMTFTHRSDKSRAQPYYHQQALQFSLQSK